MMGTTTDRAPSEQQRSCRRIQGGDALTLWFQMCCAGLQGQLCPTGSAREDGRDPQLKAHEPAPLAPGLERNRKFSGIRKTHCNFRTQRCPNLSGLRLTLKREFREARAIRWAPCCTWILGKARKLPGPGGTRLRKWR